VEVKYKLVEEVIKHWRSSPEERALAEAILYMTNLSLTELQKLSVQEVTDILVDTIKRTERKEQQAQGRTTQVQEGEEELSKGSPSEEGNLLNLVEDRLESEIVPGPLEEAPLSFIEMKKLKRGRPKVEKETN